MQSKKWLNTKLRGADTFTESLFTTRHLDDCVPESHLLRPIWVMLNAALLKRDALLSGMYEAGIKRGACQGKVVVASVMQPTAEDGCRSNSTLRVQVN